MRPLILIGGGGHARVLADLLACQNRPVLGIVDPALPAGGGGPLGLPVLGGDEVLAAHPPDEFDLAVAFAGNGRPRQRDAVFRLWQERGYSFPSLVHPAAAVSRHAGLGPGAQVMAGAVIQANAVVDANAVINSRSSVDHDCHIGRSSHVAPGAILCGGAVVGDRCLIGAGCILLPERRVGEMSLVGAGIVVDRDVPAWSILRRPVQPS